MVRIVNSNYSVDNSVFKHLKVMLGIDIVFGANLIVSQILNQDFVKNISAITTLVLLVLAVLNVINVLISIKKKLTKKKESNEEDN